MTEANEVSKTATMMLVEHVFGGPIEQLLPAWYEDDLTPPEIARQLRGRGINVTPETIRNWRRKLKGRQTILFPGDRVVRGEAHP